MHKLKENSSQIILLFGVLFFLELVWILALEFCGFLKCVLELQALFVVSCAPELKVINKGV